MTTSLRAESDTGQQTVQTQTVFVKTVFAAVQWVLGPSQRQSGRSGLANGLKEQLRLPCTGMSWGWTLLFKCMFNVK